MYCWDGHILKIVTVTYTVEILPELNDATIASNMAVIGTAFIETELVTPFSCVSDKGVERVSTVEFSVDISATVLITDES